MGTAWEEIAREDREGKDWEALGERDSFFLTAERRLP